MNNISKKTALIVLLLGTFGIIISYMLIEEYYLGNIIKIHKGNFGIFGNVIAKTCGETKDAFINCTTVSHSKYSKLFNIPVAAYGLFLYIIISLFSCFMLYEKEKAAVPAWFLFWITLFVSIADIGLFLISVFFIKAVCLLCISTYLISFILLILLIIYFVKIKTKPLFLKIMQNDTFYLKKYLFIFFASIIFAGASAYAADYVIKGKKSDYLFEKIWTLFSKQKKIDVEVSSYIESGNKDAPITIIEFSDFLCPHCARVSNIIDDIISANPSKIKLKFINFPLDSTCNYLASRVLHKGACMLARGSVCAANQNKFEEYKKLVFEKKIKNRDFTPDTKIMQELAETSGMDVSEFEDCIYSDETLKKLHNQFVEALKLNVNSTPTLYINDRHYEYRLTKEIGAKLVKKLLVKRLLEQGKK
jgi:protein-disulfide isomerase/uncharacterized membrane protein